MGLKHPTIYIDALVGLNYGYIAPLETTYVEPSISFSGDGTEETEIPGVTRTANEIPAVLMNIIWLATTKAPVLELFSAAGMYTWLTLLCIVMLWIKKKRPPCSLLYRE